MARCTCLILLTVVDCHTLWPRTEALCFQFFFCNQSYNNWSLVLSSVLFCYIYFANPGITLQFANTRRKPNCFHLWHQLRLLKSQAHAFEEACPALIHQVMILKIIWWSGLGELECVPKRLQPGEVGGWCSLQPSECNRSWSGWEIDAICTVS